MSEQQQNPFPTDNFKKYSKKTNLKLTILEISVITSGCILYAKISRIVLFGLVFLLHF